MAARQDDAERIITVSSPEPKSENLASSGVNGEPLSSNAKQANGRNGKSFERKSIAEKVPFPHLCNDVLVICCVIANMLDPLFCYILLVDQHKNCVRFDKKLKLMVVVLRSVVDFVYILLVVFQSREGHSESYAKKYNGGGFSSIARRYLLSSFVVDILAVLPLPQVVVLVVFPATKWSHLTIAVRTLKFVIVFQLLPRVFRIYSFLKEVRWSSGIFSNSAVTKALFNLFLYVVASHGFGAFWYLFSIERKATCLQVRCHSHPYCSQNYNNSSIERLCMDDCSGKASSSDIAAFNFGIFGDAFNSDIVYSTDFIWKFSYCCWWGLQNLRFVRKTYIFILVLCFCLPISPLPTFFSSLGQGLKTSGYMWEIYFAASLTVSGLVLFALLIGNLQTILQAQATRQEELRLKGEEIKLWMTYQKLPFDIKKRIEQHEKHKWQKTRGIDIAEIFHNLPRDLRRQTTRHLCCHALKIVPEFQYANEKFLDAICGCLKPILHTAQNSIISKGDPLEEVIFITKGKLWMHSNSNSNSNWDGEELKEGGYFGEDLIKELFKHPHLSIVPVSTKTLSTRTEVEAFVLSAKDLNNVINKYWWDFSRELMKDPSYNERRKEPNYQEPWAMWAALLVEKRWRRNVIKKREQRKLLLTIESRNSQPSVAKNIHIFGFSIERLKKALRETQSKKKRKRCKDILGPSNNV